MIALNHDTQHAADDLWACPRCGDKDWRVADSRFDGTERRRQRVCRNCHESLPTVELPQPKGFRVVLVLIAEHAQPTS